MAYTVNTSYRAKYYNKNTRYISNIKYIVIHYTANSGSTATAKGNANYFKNCPRKASAHYIVDENNTVYQCVPDINAAYAVGDSGHGKMKNIVTNGNSISIEMVSHTNSSGVYYIPESTIQRTVELTKFLMKKYNIPVKNVYRHYDVTKKLCPAPFVNSPSQWTSFKNRLTGSDEVEKQIKIKLNGKTKTVNVIEKDGYNYVKLQDLRDDKIEINYDGLPIINSK